MSKFIKIAGVSVNTEALPEKDLLIESAMQSKDYYRKPKAEAVKDINLKIKESGLYNNLSKGSATKDKPE